MSPARKRFFGAGPHIIREALASARLDRDETIDLGPPIPGRGDNPAVADGAGLGDRLRELRAELAAGAAADGDMWWIAGRDAGVWLASLEMLAEQADALESDRALWRGRIAQVRAEAAGWVAADDEGRFDEPTSPEIVWCSERIRFALGD